MNWNSPDPIAPCLHRVTPPAHGRYTDNQFGVQKPPANVELSFISDLELAVTNPQQGFLNNGGINSIRFLPGRGMTHLGRALLGAGTGSGASFIPGG